MKMVRLVDSLRFHHRALNFSAARGCERRAGSGKRLFKQALIVGIVVAILPCLHAKAQGPLERLEQVLERLDGGQEDDSATLPVPQPAGGQVQDDQDNREQGVLPPPRRDRPIEQLEQSLPLSELFPYLGVFTSDLTRGLALELDSPVASGAVVDIVVPESPAAAAGLTEGAVIVAMDGRRVDRSFDLESHMRRKRPGDEITLLVYDGPTLRRLPVVLGGISEATRNAMGDPRLLPDPRTEGEPVLPRQETSGIDPRFDTGPPVEQDERADEGREGPLRFLDRGPIFNGDERRRNRESRDQLDPSQLLELIELQQRQIEELERRIVELERLAIQRGAPR